MKESPDIRAVMDRMKPGVLSRDGFLGTDPRSLGDILSADHNRVERAGLTHARIAARLRELRSLGLVGLGEFVVAPPHFEVKVESVRGRLPCPFGDPGLHAKTNISLRDTRTGRQILFTDLGLHLIEAHGFYQGTGAVFRLDPDDLMDFLELRDS